jgi:hypothetical protein
MRPEKAKAQARVFRPAKAWQRSSAARTEVHLPKLGLSLVFLRMLAFAKPVAIKSSQALTDLVCSVFYVEGGSFQWEISHVIL